MGFIPMEVTSIYYIIGVIFTTFLGNTPSKAQDPTPPPEVKFFKDASFPVSNRVMGRNVTCGAHIPGEYPGPTWTCADMKVDGKRVAFGYHPDVSTSGFCTETKGRENLAAVCRALLRRNQITKAFWAVTVSEATCSFTTEKRMIVLENNRTFSWSGFPPGQGWVITIHCTTKPDV